MNISQNTKDKLKPLLNIVKSSTFYVCLVIIVADLIITKQICSESHVSYFIPIILVEFLIEGVMIALLLFAKKKAWPLEKKFLILAIGLGAMFIIFLPPGESPDEQNHFRRAYGIAQGTLIADDVINDAGYVGSYLPSEIDLLVGDTADRYLKLTDELFRTNSGEETEQAYSTTALYNFLCYLPQVLAALLGRLFNLPILITAYLMEIFNFTVWTILVYFAIKLIPKFKTAVLFIALLPITLQEATSLAPDALTIGLSIFLISYVLYLAYSKKGRLQRTEYVILYAMAFLIGFCKIVYVPLILLYLLIPKERFGSKKHKVIHLLIIFGVTAILNLSWLAISSGLLIEFMPGVDSKAQLINILTNPAMYLMTAYRTTNLNLLNWLSGMLGMSLGNFVFFLPNILFITSFVIMILLFGQRNESLKMSLFNRCVFAGVFVVIVGLIFTSLYIQWTAAGLDRIEGIQGRYFLPILLLIPIMICRNDKGKKAERNKKYPVIISENTVLYYSMFVGIMACVTIFAQNI